MLDYKFRMFVSVFKRPVFSCLEQAPACFSARGWILTNVLLYCFYCSLTGPYTPKPSMSSAARIDGVFLPETATL